MLRLFPLDPQSVFVGLRLSPLDRTELPLLFLDFQFRSRPVVMEGGGVVTGWDGSISFTAYGEAEDGASGEGAVTEGGRGQCCPTDTTGIRSTLRAM